MCSAKRALSVAAIAGLSMSSGVSSGSAASTHPPVQTRIESGAHDVPSTATLVAAFVRYLAGLRAQDEVSKDVLEHAVGLHMAPISSGARYRSDDVGGGWNVFVDYFAGTKTIRPAAVLQFINEHDEYADMSPVCGTEFEAVRAILMQGGYTERESLGEIGNFQAWEYSRRHHHLVATAGHAGASRPHAHVHSNHSYARLRWTAGKCRPADVPIRSMAQRRIH
jgi:hypothetical protein